MESMTQPEMAVQKLNELRELVDGDGEVADLVDTLAMLMILKQNTTNAMYGAKVTYYEKPQGEWVEVDYDHYRSHVENGDLLPDDPEEAWQMDNEVFDRYEDAPWYLRWRRHDGDNHKPTPEGEIAHKFHRYFGYGEKRKVERDEVPDPLDPSNDLAKDTELAESQFNDPASDWFGEWTIYEADFREYRFTPYVPVEDYVGRRAIVVEPHIADQPSGTEFWDPNKQEYTTPDDYPMGTVNVVVPDDPEDEFGEDYTYEMRVETSVTPADGDVENPTGHVYTPGWN